MFSIFSIKSKSKLENIENVLVKYDSVKFVYDPDNGIVFDQWYRKYENVFLKDWAKLGLSVTVYDNFVLPKHPCEYPFQETVKKLEELFEIRISMFS